MCVFVFLNSNVAGNNKRDAVRFPAVLLTITLRLISELLLVVEPTNERKGPSKILDRPEMIPCNNVTSCATNVMLLVVQFHKVGARK